MEGSGAKKFLFIGISHRRSLEHRDFKQTQLILIKLGSGKSVNYWGLFSLDLAFTRRKLTYPCLWQVCIRELWLRKSSQNVAATLVQWAQWNQRAVAEKCFFGIDITQEPGLLLSCGFFKSSLIHLPIQSRSFSLVALTVLSSEALT